MHELSTIITDVYALSGERFGHDLIQFIGMCEAVAYGILI